MSIYRRAVNLRVKLRFIEGANNINGKLLGNVLSEEAGQELTQILGQAMAAERSQAVEEASIQSLKNHRAVIDLHRKDQRRHIGERYTATSTRCAGLLSFDLKCSNTDLLEELTTSLGGDCVDPAVSIGNFVKERVTLEARSLERIVTLARANMCAIRELGTSLQMGTHHEGGWDCVQALMDNTVEFNAKFTDEKEIFERMREGKKRARLMASAK